MAHSTRGQPLEPDARTELGKRIAFYGDFAICKAIGISRHALARAVGGLPMYAATRRAVYAYLRGQR